LATGFPLASELTVVDVALVARVARFGSSAGFGSSILGSVFLGRPFGLAAATLGAGTSTATVVTGLLRVERVAGLASSFVFVAISVAMRGVTLTRRRGAAARGCGALDTEARVRGAMLNVKVCVHQRIESICP